MTIGAVWTVAEKFGRMSLSVLIIGVVGPIETGRGTDWIGMEFVAVVIGGGVGGHAITLYSKCRPLLSDHMY